MPRGRLIFIFAIVLCLPCATVAWLAKLLLDQDRALETQRLADSREQLANRAVQTLTGILSNPALFAHPPADGALLANLPGARLLFHRQPPVPFATHGNFASAEALEFHPGDAPRALEAYRQLARSDDSRTRAGALLRLGRSLARAGRTAEALETFERLAAMESAHVEGWPAPLAAIWSRANLLDSAPPTEALRSEALRLRRILDEARHPITKATYIAFASDAARWSGQPQPLERERLTDAVLAVEANVRGKLRPQAGNEVLNIGGESITVIWREASESLSVFAATSRFVAREWLSQAGEGVWLRDADGRVFGTPAKSQAAVRHPFESRLPWTVLAVNPPQPSQLGARRSLLLILLATVLAITLAGAYFILRSLRKELALARMQEDFVAAVSHEFRTPLTTLRQLTETLEEGRINPERRLSTYRSLSRATQRLHRLVEDLLDFRRMQSGALEYRRTALEARAFTLQVAADFQREVEDRGFQVVASTIPDAVLHADREALTRALWNLLDNAVKYSGEQRSIALDAAIRDGSLEWSVRDHGIGIPSAELPHVFQKFFRGEQARRAGIRGTGIGLAMVQQIAQAHGGTVSASSQPGAGSTFTISIPLEPATCHTS